METVVPKYWMGVAFWMEGVKGARHGHADAAYEIGGPEELRGISALRNMAMASGYMVNMATNRFTPPKVRIMPVRVRL